MIEKMKQDQKGLSLVELVVAIAILAIVATAIAGFMVTGSRSYASTSSEVNIQYESQLTTNQISDLLIDATEGISYEIDGSLYNKDSEGPASPSNKKLSIFTSVVNPTSGLSDYFADIVEWKLSDQKLYYSRYHVTKTGNVYTLGTAVTTNKLMSDYATGFSANLDQVSSNNIFQLSMDFENAGKKYHTNNNITLRNTLAVNRKSSSVSGGTPPFGSYVVTDVDISPGDIILAPGGVANFSAFVKGTGSPPQAVTWDITTPAALLKAGTKIDAGGKVTVDASETIASFTVRVTSVADPSISKTANVYVKKIDSLTLSGGPAHIYKNTSFTLIVNVAGTNLTEADKAVRWTIDEGAAYVGVTGTNTFKIAANAPKGLKVTIRANSAIDSSISDSWSGTVESGIAGGGGGGPKIVISSPGTINRNGSGTFAAETEDAAGYTIKWDVKVYKKGEPDKKYSDISYDVDVKGEYCTVSISKLLNYEEEATVQAIATLVKTGETESSPRAESNADVHKVSLSYRKSNDITPLANVSTKIYYVQSKSVKYSYILDGIENVGALSWSGYDKNVLKITDSGSEISLGAGGSAEGKETAIPSIGSYKMDDNTVTVNIKGGNVYFDNGTVGETGISWFYVPLPNDPDFQGYGKEDTYKVSAKERMVFEDNSDFASRSVSLGSGNIWMGMKYYNGVWKIFIYNKSKPWGGTAYTCPRNPNENTDWKSANFWSFDDSY